jgi:hypothetical protein
MDGKTGQRSGVLREPLWPVRSSDVARRLAGWQIQRLDFGRRSGGAAVSVVENTDLGLGHDPPLARRLHLARRGRVAIGRQVGSRVVVVGEVLT